MTHYYSDVQSDAVETSTADAFLAAPSWADSVQLEAPTDFEWAFAAKIKDIQYFDDSAGTYTDGISVTENGEGAVLVLDSFEGAADFLYIGSKTKFKSVHFIMGAANGTASVGTLKYWDGNSWEDISETDGTISTGKTLGATGTMTFTIPSDWAQTSVNGGTPAFYVRWEAATTLDSEVEVSEIILGSRITGYADVNDGPGVLNNAPIIPFNKQKVGGVLVKGAADTPLVVTTWYGNN